MTSKRRFFCFSVIAGACLWSSFSQAGTVDYTGATIPVLDLNDFYHSDTKQTFVDQLAKAMHEVGFFAVIHPHVSEETLIEAYDASKQFFSGSMEQKEEIFDLQLNGQRGYVPGEIAQGYKKKDLKEFLHVGKNKNLWPVWMDLQTPLENLMRSLDEHGAILQEAFSLAIGEKEEYLINMTEKGECLLRSLHYPIVSEPGTVWAAEHTDIDLFTILPMSTEEGLQIFYQGEWVDVKVPANAFIVNCGDKLQNLTNGYFKSALHRVVPKLGAERYSIVYFVHPRDDDFVSPTNKCIELTGGVSHYPEASSLELLACRLRELGLASPELLELEQKSGILDRMKALIEKGVAAEPVKKTYSLWIESQKSN